MQHILSEICAAPLADRQHPSSGGFVPTTALGGHQLLPITPAFLALPLAEQHLKTRPYLHPRKNQTFAIAFFAEEIRMFLWCKNFLQFQAKDGLSHNFEH